MINPTSSSVDPALLIKSDSKTVDVFLVSLDCYRQGEIMSISIKPPLCTDIISFDWISLTKSPLPLGVPFNIFAGVSHKNILYTIVDEEDSFSILSSTASKDIGSPRLVLTID